LGRIRSKISDPIGCAGGKWESATVHFIQRLDRVAVHSDGGLVGSVARFNGFKKRLKKEDEEVQKVQRNATLLFPGENLSIQISTNLKFMVQKSSFQLHVSPTQSTEK
jgi:hypothetical protein